MPLKYTTLFCLLFLFAAPSLAQKKYEADKMYTPAQLQEDFQIFQTAFMDTHPAWGRYHPVDSMRAWFAATQQQLNQAMTESDFRKKLYQLVAKLGCGHTRIKVPTSYVKTEKKKRKAEVKENYLPFQAQKVEGRLYVTYNTLADSTLLPPGTQIHGIDHKPVAQIIREMQSMYPSDGYNTSHKERVFNLDFTNHYHFYYGGKENYKLVVSFEEGEIYELELPAYTATAVEYQKEKRKRNQQYLPKDQVIYRKKGYQLRLLEDQENTAVLKIAHFDGKRGKRFYKKTFQYLAEQNIPNLVLDLRDNGGGSGKEALTLVAYINEEEMELFGKKKRAKPAVHKHLEAKFARQVLFPIFIPISFKTHRDETYLHIGFGKKKKKPNYDGKVYTLYNGLSFSSSVIVGAFLKQQDNLITIGQETGGGQAGTNAFQMPRLTLPHTRIKMIYPMFRVNTSSDKTPDNGHGLPPDYPTEPTLQDILEGRDLEMEKVRELVR